MDKDRLISRSRFQEYCGGISRSTLRYYDKMGLLKPAYTDDNGYQYYDKDQIFVYFNIAMMRMIDCSVEEIRDLIVSDSPTLYNDLFSGKIEALNYKIDMLSQARDTVRVVHNIHSYCNKKPINTPLTTEFDKPLKYCFIKKTGKLSIDMDFMLNKRMKHKACVDNDFRYMLYPGGIIIDREYGSHTSIDVFKGFMLAVRDKEECTGCQYTPTGKVAMYYYKTEHPFNNLGKMDILYNYIKSNNYTLKSDYYVLSVPYAIKSSSTTEYLNIIHVGIDN